MKKQVAINSFLMSMALGVVRTDSLPTQPTKLETVFVCGQSFSLLLPFEIALKMATASGECSVKKIMGDAYAPSYGLFLKGGTRVFQGMLDFKLGRLTAVSKNWDLDVHDEIDYGRVLIGLLHKFEEDGCSAYEARTEYRSTPEIDSKTAFLRCGHRQIMLVSSEYKGVKSIQITETLRN